MISASDKRGETRPASMLKLVYKLDLKSSGLKVHAGSIPARGTKLITMTSLKDAIHEKHKIAERKNFNLRMLNGELSEKEYVKYLIQQLAIFSEIERFDLPSPVLARKEKISLDISELHRSVGEQPDLLESTKSYVSYLSGLNQVELLPHVYLNYLALVFGGQMMKSKVPGSGKMFDFEDKMTEAVTSIRSIQKDEWADESNKGLDYLINIFDEL